MDFEYKKGSLNSIDHIEWNLNGEPLTLEAYEKWTEELKEKTRSNKASADMKALIDKILSEGEAEEDSLSNLESDPLSITTQDATDGSV